MVLPEDDFILNGNTLANHSLQNHINTENIVWQIGLIFVMHSDKFP
jgi:hypothetical protein